MRTVWLSSEDYSNDAWLAVLVHSSTGVAYKHQTGGFASTPRVLESYYLPLFNGEALHALRAIFEDALGGAGTHRLPEFPADLMPQLQSSVSLIHMASSIEPFAEVALVVDQARVAEIDEAWVPVITPDGQGVLIWQNSD